tara:strand:+ start:246 stop:665 length:420 start_codon:yes stop_codon:yes gene_type:complete
MDNDKTSWSNVIVGPWPTSEKLQDSKPLKGGKTREQIVEEEMNIVDGLTENLMVSLIHSLKENDFKISGKDFIRDIGFMSEVLKSLLFRELGYNHPLSDLIPYIIVPTRTKDKKDVYTKFRGDIVVDILEYLEGFDDEE